MKFIKNKRIDNFFNICDNNIKNNFYNDYLGYKIIDEKKIISKLRKLQAYEFVNGLDSLYLSEDFMENSYYKNIDLSNIKYNEFSLEELVVVKDEIFNYDVVQDDPNRELNDYLKLRALKNDLKIQALYQKEKLWMLNVPSESITIDPYAKKANGKVVTFGLGIGYFVYQALENPLVEEITVVEKSLEIVELFKKYILSQFSSNKKIDIIVGDAFDYFNPKFLCNYDYCFVDIWQSSDDGLKIITQLLEIYNPKKEKVDFWIEKSSMESVTGLIYLYLKTKYFEKEINTNLNEFERKIFAKINEYFEQNLLEINKVEQLKSILYDQELKRKILAI